jgi:hypothetical protein
MTKSPLGFIVVHFEDATGLDPKGTAYPVMTHGLALLPVSSDWTLHHLAFLAGGPEKKQCSGLSVPSLVFSVLSRWVSCGPDISGAESKL